MNKSRKNPGWQSLCSPLPSVKISQVLLPDVTPSLTCVLTQRHHYRNRVTRTRRWVWMGGNWKEVLLSVLVKVPQSVEKRSPAEGSGARPPVTLGRRERSGRLWMWDLSSFLTWVTRASFCLYSCRHQTNSAQLHLHIPGQNTHVTLALKGSPLVSFLSPSEPPFDCWCIQSAFGLAVSDPPALQPVGRYTLPAVNTLHRPSSTACLLHPCLDWQRVGCIFTVFI